MKHKGRTWRKRKKRGSCGKVISLANKPDYILLFKWAKKNGITFYKMKPCLFPNTGRGLMSTGQQFKIERQTKNKDENHPHVVESNTNRKNEGYFLQFRCFIDVSRLS